jgi:nucleoside-diphosphate-sugar epimerase
MRCIVTGADGFIGSHLVEALLNTREVTHVTAMVHREPVRWLSEANWPGTLSVLRLDVQRDSSVAKLPDADVVFHLAAISSAGRCENAPEVARLTNFQGTVNLLNRCLLMRPLPRFIFTSTAALYGEPEYLPVDENHPVEPKSSYTYTKISSEITISSYQRDQGLPAVIIRPFNVYGPRQSEDFVVSTIVQQVLQGIQLRLGDGRPIRNFTYVTDAANFLVRAAMAPGAIGRIFNMGTREAVSISGIVEMVVAMTSSHLEVIYDRGKFRDGDPTILEMEPALAELLLRWTPKVPLKAGLAKTIEHFRAEMVVAQQMSADHLYSQY